MTHRSLGLLIVAGAIYGGDKLQAEGFLPQLSRQSPKKFHNEVYKSPALPPPPHFSSVLRAALPLGPVASCDDDKLSPVAPSPKFAGKTVLVTGSSSGIGAAMCFEVARRGARRVVMLSRDREGMERVRDGIVKEVSKGKAKARRRGGQRDKARPCQVNVILPRASKCA